MIATLFKEKAQLQLPRIDPLLPARQDCFSEEAVTVVEMAPLTSCQQLQSKQPIGPPIQEAIDLRVMLDISFYCQKSVNKHRIGESRTRLALPTCPPIGVFHGSVACSQ